MIHTLKQISIIVYDKFLKYKTINHRVKGVKTRSNTEFKWLKAISVLSVRNIHSSSKNIVHTHKKKLCGLCETLSGLCVKKEV
jgi:hypothetical protein